MSLYFPSRVMPTRGSTPFCSMVEYCGCGFVSTGLFGELSTRVVDCVRCGWTRLALRQRCLTQFGLPLDVPGLVPSQLRLTQFGSAARCTWVGPRPTAAHSVWLCRPMY